MFVTVSALHMHVNHYVALQWVTYKSPARASDQDGVNIRLESMTAESCGAPSRSAPRLPSLSSSSSSSSSSEQANLRINSYNGRTYVREKSRATFYTVFLPSYHPLHALCITNYGLHMTVRYPTVCTVYHALRITTNYEPGRVTDEYICEFADRRLRPCLYLTGRYLFEYRL